MGVTSLPVSGSEGEPTSGWIWESHISTFVDSPAFTRGVAYFTLLFDSIIGYTFLGISQQSIVAKYPEEHHIYYIRLGYFSHIINFASKCAPLRPLVLASACCTLCQELLE